MILVIVEVLCNIYHSLYESLTFEIYSIGGDNFGGTGPRLSFYSERGIFTDQLAFGSSTYIRRGSQYL